MSVVIETTAGDITVDLFLAERPSACMNFLKLCKLKYYNYNLFHTISRGFIAQTGDPTGSRTGGESIFGVLKGPTKRFFQGETKPRIKHTKMGLISFVGDENFMLGSQFFITLGEDLTYLDEKHCVFGEVVDGFDVLEIINEVICDGDDRPYQDVRITHTVVLDDPFPDPEGLNVPARSPSPSAERMMGGRIAPDEEIDETEGKSAAEIAETQADREAKARATILEMVGDIPDADMAPPENVLFVCKLNPVTTDEDLEIIFNRFGKIKSCEVIRDRKTGDSLQYAFIEFEDRKACEDAYFKMDNILIDDRRIHVDFSQSVSKVKWLGKGRGVTHYDEKGRKIEHGSEYQKNKNANNSSNRHESHDSKSSNRSQRDGDRKTVTDNYTKSDKYRNSKYEKYENGKDKDYKYDRKSRSDYDKRPSRRYSNSPKRDKTYNKISSEGSNYRRKHGECISKNKHARNDSPRRRPKNQRGDSSGSDRNSSRKLSKHLESEEDYKKKSKKRVLSEDKEIERQTRNEDKYVARTTSRKRNAQKSSSESSESDEKYRKKTTKKSKRSSSSSSDSSSDDTSKYKKKKHKKRSRKNSNLDDKVKNRKFEKKAKKRKSNDNSDSERDRKRKRR